MPKVCDNKSVGVLVIDGNKLLMIDRGNYPRCKAFPAGHLDGGNYPQMALTEVREEVGLEIPMRELNMIYENPLANPCKRDGGSHHDWRVYSVRAENLPHLNVKAGDDAKRAFWASKEEWTHYAVRTEYFFSKLGLEWRDVGTLTLKVFGHPKTGPVTDEEKALYEEWARDPGLEPCWYFMLRMARIFSWTFQNAPTDPFHPEFVPGSD